MQVLRFSSKRSVTQVTLDPPKIMSIIMPPALSNISKHWPSGFVGTHNVQYDFQYYQISISCFLLDIDLTYKLSRIY